MATAPLAIAVGAATALVALLVLALRPYRTTNAWLAAVLLLYAGLAPAQALVADAGSVAEARVHGHTAIWLSLAFPPLLLGLAGALLPGRAPRLPLAVATILSAAGAVAFALDRELFALAFGPRGPGYAMTSGPLLYLLAAFVALAQAYAVQLAERAAQAGPHARAALAGLAFALLPVHTAAFFLTFSLLRPEPLADTLYLTRVLGTLLAVALLAPALARLVRGLDEAPRRGAVALLALLVLLGLADGVLAARPDLFALLPGYERSVLLLRLAAALLLGLAAVRFGMADAGARERAHARRVLRVATLALLAIAPVALALLALGLNVLGLALGAVLAVGAPAIGRRAADRAASALARRLLLADDDPRAVAARARAYAGAVEAARDGGAEGERLLAELRDDLGISEREHALLAQGLASREAPRHRMERVLGEGATARVALALDAEGRRVVVKRFRDPRDAARVLREARAMMRVRHPRVLPLLAADREGDEARLVMPYAEGGSARALLDREGPLPPERAIAITLDLLDGLAALHHAGIIHCDVKPENILLDANGRAMIGDLGSARLPDADTTTSAEGTLATLAPEALRGAPPTPARDLYATGATLYRLLTAEHPIPLDGASAFEARERILLDPPRLPHPRIPPPLAAVLERALAKHPSERHASATEMRAALADAMGRG